MEQTEYACRECHEPVLYRSDHREGCSYGLPVLNHAVERREVFAGTNAAYAMIDEPFETPYTHPSMPGTPPDPYYNVNPQ